MSIKEGTTKLAHALLLPINPSAVILLGIYTVAWGLWVANPFWEVFTSAKLFSALAATGVPEWAWGCFAILCGCITIYGAVRRRYGSLIRGALAAHWHWLMIAAFYFIGDALNTGGITSFFFCVYAAYIYLNIKVNFKDDKKSAEILH